MPVTNIRDSRSNKYNIHIQAIFEESWHDNTINGATQFNGSTEDDIMYLCVANTTVEKAILYAMTHIKTEVTLFIYDVGSNDSCTHTGINDKLELVR